MIADFKRSESPADLFGTFSRRLTVLDLFWIIWYREQKGMEEKGMKKEIIVSEELSRPLGIYSQAVKAEGSRLLFISGMTARDKDGNIVGKGDMKAQTRQVLENIKAVLEKAGATFDQIIKVTVFITDMSRFKEIHEVRAQYFKKDYPASTMVQVSGLVSPDMLIEIEAIAVLD
jgi:2-iminobutanoate/2-iminopropanoate deaminase